MNKVTPSVSDAVRPVHDGSIVLIGGFGGSGNPNNLIDALLKHGATGLTIVSNDWTQWVSLLERGRIKKIISGFTNHPFRPEVSELIESLCQAEKLELETVPHGILEERIRAAKVGIAAFYCSVGLGTDVELAKEKRTIEGKECLLHHALRADFALVKGFKGDSLGNLQCRLAAGNRNITMAGAAKVTIAEVEEIVEPGEIAPEDVDIPGIFIQKVVKAFKRVCWLDGHEKPGYLKAKP
ncbi:MAG: CoA transferase subunit A [Chloroflexi bacterium]|nr:CoA transferase subunit A [Chloroflexota bacterium]